MLTEVVPSTTRLHGSESIYSNGRKCVSLKNAASITFWKLLKYMDISEIGAFVTSGLVKRREARGSAPCSGLGPQLGL